MEWIYLLIAGMFETGWAVGLKYTDGLTKFYPTIFTGLCLIFSMYLLEKAIRVIPIGTGYAVWTGIGIIGTATLGIVLLGESMDISRLFFIALIIIGISGLKMVSA
jgi:quaternary ammonium compound-resistance protein SugE